MTLVLVAAPTWAALAQDRTGGLVGGFVGGVEDLPLMAGLDEVAEAGMVFDKPAGRIVEAFAVGQVEARAVRAFYAAALPQLGWTQVGAGTFVREGESLIIDIEGDGATLTVRFSIAPR